MADLPQGLLGELRPCRPVELASRWSNWSASTATASRVHSDASARASGRCCAAIISSAMSARPTRCWSLAAASASSSVSSRRDARSLSISTRRSPTDCPQKWISITATPQSWHSSRAKTIDVCFTSNLFEHLPSKQALDALLGEVWRVLKPGGLLVAMQPNIKYAPGDYWDFYDHHIPLSHLSCAEAFRLAEFDIDELVARFLPFTTCSPLPKHPLLVRLYLAVRPAWRILGRQFLIVGRKRAAE